MASSTRTSTVLGLFSVGLAGGLYALSRFASAPPSSSSCSFSSVVSSQENLQTQASPERHQLLPDVEPSLSTPVLPSLPDLDGLAQLIFKPYGIIDLSSQLVQVCSLLKNVDFTSPDSWCGDGQPLSQKRYALSDDVTLLYVPQPREDGIYHHLLLSNKKNLLARLPHLEYSALEIRLVSEGATLKRVSVTPYLIKTLDSSLEDLRESYIENDVLAYKFSMERDPYGWLPGKVEGFGFSNLKKKVFDFPASLIKFQLDPHQQNIVVHNFEHILPSLQ